MSKFLIAFSLPVLMIIGQALPSKADGDPCEYIDETGEIQYAPDGEQMIIDGEEQVCLDGEWFPI